MIKTISIPDKLWADFGEHCDNNGFSRSGLLKVMIVELLNPSSAIHSTEVSSPSVSSASQSATHPKSKTKPSATTSQSDGSKLSPGLFPGVCSHGSMLGICKRGCK